MRNLRREDKDLELQKFTRGYSSTTLSPSPSPSERVAAGFTLAETLITLVIIGVVAALTVPTMIAKYQKEQTVTRLKKAYTTIAQAVSRSEIENGVTDNWDYRLSSKDFYDKYLDKYLVNAKIIGNINASDLGIEFKNLAGSLLSDSWTIKNVSAYRVVLNDGTMLHVNSYIDNKSFRLIYVDINGNKKPNQFGRDIFALSIQARYKVTPYGLGAAQENGTHAGFGNVADRDMVIGNETNDSYSCRKDRSGLYCTALIMLDGWQIKDDYPW